MLTIESSLVRELVEKANCNIDLNDGTTGAIKKILADADLVIAVWQDYTAAHGVGMLPVKGQQILTNVFADVSLDNVRIDAIACDCEEHAIALKETLGERDRLETHRHPARTEGRSRPRSDFGPSPRSMMLRFRGIAS
jgi:hypothetical protein